MASRGLSTVYHYSSEVIVCAHRGLWPVPRHLLVRVFWDGDLFPCRRRHMKKKMDYLAKQANKQTITDSHIQCTGIVITASELRLQVHSHLLEMFKNGQYSTSTIVYALSIQSPYLLSWPVWLQCRGTYPILEETRNNH